MKGRSRSHSVAAARKGKGWGSHHRPLPFPGDLWHLSVRFRHSQGEWGLSKRQLDSQIPPNKQLASVKKPARGYFAKCSEDIFRKIFPVVQSAPMRQWSLQRKKEAFFAGGWVGTGSSPKMLLGGPFRTVLFSSWSKCEVTQPRNHNEHKWPMKWPLLQTIHVLFLPVWRFPSPTSLASRSDVWALRMINTTKPFHCKLLSQSPAF